MLEARAEAFLVEALASAVVPTAAVVPFEVDVKSVTVLQCLPEEHSEYLSPRRYHQALPAEQLRQARRPGRHSVVPKPAVGSAIRSVLRTDQEAKPRQDPKLLSLAATSLQYQASAPSSEVELAPWPSAEAGLLVSLLTGQSSRCSAEASLGALLGAPPKQQKAQAAHQGSSLAEEHRMVASQVAIAATQVSSEVAAASSQLVKIF